MVYRLKSMGPFLNEYMYQEALDISLEENGICSNVVVFHVFASRKF